MPFYNHPVSYISFISFLSLLLQLFSPSSQAKENSAELLTKGQYWTTSVRQIRKRTNQEYVKNILQVFSISTWNFSDKCNCNYHSLEYKTTMLIFCTITVDIMSFYQYFISAFLCVYSSKVFERSSCMDRCMLKRSCQPTKPHGLLVKATRCTQN